MAGIWQSDNKVLPGAYINIKTNETLSITSNERGRVLILQELSSGTDNKIYKKTIDEDTFETSSTIEDKKMSELVLKNASTVYVVKLKTGHKIADVKACLDIVKTLKFDILVYPYDTGKEDIKEAIKTFVSNMREVEGLKISAVIPNYVDNHEAIINVVQTMTLKDNSILNVGEVSAYVAGLYAGAGMLKSNTGVIFDMAKDVNPRFTKTQLEEAIKAGKFVFKVDGEENVSVVYDINSLTSFTKEKSMIFAKNRVLRTLDSVASDIAKVFESSYLGKVNNTIDGRNILKSTLIDYFRTLEALNAIEDFDVKDISIKTGNNIDSVIVDLKIKPVDSVEKIYINVNLA